MSQQLLHFVERSALIHQCADKAVPQFVYTHIIQTQLCANTAPFAEHTALGFVCVRIDEQPSLRCAILLLQTLGTFNYTHNTVVECDVAAFATLQ